jgi:hypothetical protein
MKMILGEEKFQQFMQRARKIFRNRMPGGKPMPGMMGRPPMGGKPMPGMNKPPMGGTMGGAPDAGCPLQAQ